MKTKLLKKVRKRFEINYHPNIDSDRKYIITDLGFGDYSRYMYFSYTTLNAAIDALISIIQKEYYEGSNKQKRRNLKTKVWYNG